MLLSRAWPLHRFVSRKDLTLAMFDSGVILRSHFYPPPIKSVFCFQTISLKPLAGLLSYNIAYTHPSGGCRCAFWGLWPLTQSILKKINVKSTLRYIYQRSTLTVVRWSETPRNHVGPPEHSNSVVRWTTEIFSSKQNRNMAKKSKQSSPLAADNTRNTVPLSPLFTEQNKCL